MQVSVYFRLSLTIPGILILFEILDSVQVAHYTSDRVTEVESVSQQKMTKSSSQIIDNIDAIVPSTSVDDPAEYIDKLNKSQEVSLV